MVRSDSYFSSRDVILISALSICAVLLSYFLIPIPPVDHEEMDSIVAALDSRDEPFYPILGYSVLAVLLEFSSEKGTILLFSMLLLFPMLLISLSHLGRSLRIPRSLLIAAIVLLILNPIFIAYFLHTLSMAFPIFTLLNMLSLIFFFKFVSRLGNGRHMHFGLLFILTQILASYTALFAFASLFSMFLSGLFVLSLKGKLKSSIVRYSSVFMMILLPTVHLLQKLSDYGDTQGSEMIVTETISSFFLSFSYLFPAVILLIYSFYRSYKEDIPRIRSSRGSYSSVLFFSYTLILLSVFLLSSILLRFNAFRTMSFTLPIIYFSAICIPYCSAPRRHKKALHGMMMIFVFLPGIVFSSSAIMDHMSYAGGFSEFRESVYSHIASGNTSSVVFSPYTVFYQYKNQFGLGYEDMLTDDGALILRQYYTEGIPEPELSTDKMEIASHKIHLTPKVPESGNMALDTSIERPLLLVIDSRYPDYYDRDHISEACTEMISYSHEALYLCEDDVA